jgi:hypothetical protein
MKYLTWNDAREIQPGNRYASFEYEFLIRLSFEDDLSMPIYTMANWMDNKFIPNSYCFECDSCNCSPEIRGESIKKATITHWALIQHYDDMEDE